MRLATLAPGKVNLCLFLGPVRGDGRHEVATVIESVSLADEVSYEPAAANEVVCPGVEGPNLALAALEAYGGAPARIRIEKRVPVAAGMGGGSGDAAAALRLAAHAAGRPDDPRLGQLAAALGADVPSQLRPGLTLGTGAGEVVEPVPPRAAHALLILPQPTALSTPAVFAEADRLGLPRPAAELAAKLEEVRAALAAGSEWPAELLMNDLEPAALALCPPIGDALAAAREAGADAALVSGSGPTVVGVFRGAERPGPAEPLDPAEPLRRAQLAAESLRDRFPRAAAAVPVDAGFAAVRELP